MKKNVIKRRKRVPAASAASASPTGGPGRMTDQAAAEALVAVGRYGTGAGTEESENEGDPDQPRRKRMRKSANNKKDDDIMDWEGGEKRQWIDAGVSAPYVQMQRFPGYDSSSPSYIRSSASPGRTHSPSGHVGSSSGMMVGAGGSFALPPPHGLSYLPPPPKGSVGEAAILETLATIMMAIPSVTTLEQHYARLQEFRREQEMMLEKTDRLLSGVKRGLDQMKQAGQGGGESDLTATQSATQQQSGGASALPLQTRSDKGANVWSITDR